MIIKLPDLTAPDEQYTYLDRLNCQTGPRPGWRLQGGHESYARLWRRDPRKRQVLGEVRRAWGNKGTLGFPSGWGRGSPGLLNELAPHLGQVRGGSKIEVESGL